MGQFSQQKTNFKMSFMHLISFSILLQFCIQTPKATKVVGV